MFRRYSASSRRALVSALGTALLIAGVGTAGASPDPHAPPSASTGWVGTWATGPTGVPETGVTTLADQTVRQVVHVSIGGDQVQVRLTNEHGDTPLHLGEVRVALRAGDTGTDIDPSTDRPVTFGGSASVVIPPGAPVLGDPVRLHVAPDSDLVVSIYLPDPTPVTTVHNFAFQLNAIADGNVTAEPSVTPTASPEQWLFLSSVSVTASPRTASIVALGDSITDGAFSAVGANHRWPDLLSDRLQAARGFPDRGVLNLGISGNRLLHDANAAPGSGFEGFVAYFGDAALRRFDRDVLSQPGAEYVITLLGVNDIALPGAIAPPEEAVTAQQLIDGHRQLIARAHARGLRIYGGTIMPFQSSDFWTPEHEATRAAVNAWIRTSGEYDAVVDFDAAVRDPANPLRLHPDYDGGDGLHPNDEGMAALARAVPLHLFR